MNDPKTYDEYLVRQEQIDNLIKDMKLSNNLLASLLRLRHKEHQTKDPNARFMQSEFAGMELEKAIESGFVSREYRKFDWHPKEEGTYYYRLTEKGSQTIEKALRILNEHHIELYY